MTDILKSMAGGWAFLVSWVFPSALAWIVLGYLALPSLTAVDAFRMLLSTSSTNQLIALSVAAFLTGILLASVSTVMYRILEGYVLLPKRWQGRLRASQARVLAARKGELDALTTRKKELKEALGGRSPGAAHSELVGIDISIGLAREKLRRYPDDLEQLAPTEFANALRSIETYGWNRYRLDSQVLWWEILSVAPAPLRDAQETARAPINFFVSLVLLSAITGSCLIGLSVGTAAGAQVGLFGLLLLGLVRPWYRLAILSTRSLASAVQALVNTARVPLAEQLGLALPPTLVAERDMWERLWWSVYVAHDPKYAADLDEYRTVAGDDSRAAPAGADEPKADKPEP